MAVAMVVLLVWAAALGALAATPVAPVTTDSATGVESLDSAGEVELVALCVRGAPEARDEWFVLQNTGEETLDLAGWVVSDSPEGGHRFVITDTVLLLPGQTLAIINTAIAVVSPEPDHRYCLQYHSPWINNEGDTICLWDGQGLRRGQWQVPMETAE